MKWNAVDVTGGTRSLLAGPEERAPAQDLHLARLRTVTTGRLSRSSRTTNGPSILRPHRFEMPIAETCLMDQLS